MNKSTITRIWLGGVILLAAGLLIGGIALAMMLIYGGHFTTTASGNGYDFVPTFDSFFWTMVSLTIVGCVVAAVGCIVQLAAWIGALVNTYQLEDRTWFVVLLAGGLLGLAFGLVGFAAMIAYVIAGPDSTSEGARHMPMPSQQIPVPAS